MHRHNNFYAFHHADCGIGVIPCYDILLHVRSMTSWLGPRRSEPLASALWYRPGSPTGVSTPRKTPSAEGSAIQGPRVGCVIFARKQTQQGSFLARRLRHFWHRTRPIPKNIARYFQSEGATVVFLSRIGNVQLHAAATPCSAAQLRSQCSSECMLVRYRKLYLEQRFAAVLIATCSAFMTLSSKSPTTQLRLLLLRFFQFTW